jgi:hypothetical protein
VAGVGSFERLVESTVVQICWRVAERKSGIRAGDTPVHVAMGYWRLPPLVDIDVGCTEEFVDHLVAG